MLHEIVMVLELVRFLNISTSLYHYKQRKQINYNKLRPICQNNLPLYTVA